MSKANNITCIDVPHPPQCTHWGTSPPEGKLWEKRIATGLLGPRNDRINLTHAPQVYLAAPLFLCYDASVRLISRYFVDCEVFIMPELLETCMMILFGLSWPMNIIRSVRSRTAKGKSVWFLCFIILGYLAGIAAKITAGNVTYVLFFYVLNILMVSVDITLYFRNRRLDRLAEAGN